MKLKKINPETLKEFFGQAPIALAVMKGEELIIQAANQLMREFMGITEDKIGLPMLEAQPQFVGTKFIPIMHDVLRTGTTFKGFEEEFTLMKNGIPKQSFYNFSYSPFEDNFGNIQGIIVVANDVTEQVIAKNQMNEKDALFKSLIMESEVPTVLYSGEDLTVEIINARAREAWGKNYEVIGMKLEDALPEIREMPYLNIIKEVYRTGNIYMENDARVDFDYNGEIHTKYYNIIYKPIKKSNGEIYGVLNMAQDVTSHFLQNNLIKKSEKRLKNLFVSVPMAMSVLRGSDFVIEMTNITTGKLFEKGEDRIGKKLLEVYPEIKDHKIMELINEAYHSKKKVIAKELEFNLPQYEKPRFLNYIITPIDLDEEEHSLISVGYDVTEELEMKKMLKENESKFRNLAESVPQIVWTADSEGQLDYFNEQWYEYSGFPRDLFGDEAWIRIIHPDDLERVGEVWQHSIKTGENYEIEFRFLNPKEPGTFKWFLVRAIPVKNNDGKVIKWMGTSTDIHDVKMFQKQKDDFLAITSHELKTPLTSIKLYAQALERMMKKDGNDKAADFAKKMEEQVDRLNLLVVDLLDVTKIQNGHLVLKEREFNFDDLAEEMTNFMQISSEKHQLIFENGNVGTVIADRERISQVMVNFISNAVKYLPNADKVIISTQKTADGKAKFCVRDFGIGLEKDKTNKIFEQFYRVVDDKAYDGIGLGLFISAEIIKRSGGEIQVESELGKGSDFCFQI